ncbi:MAG: phosphatidate cytidylyltransferase, partial [Flavobacteriales bacterium]
LAIRLFSAWEKPTPNAMITLFGVLYISLPFALITFIALPGGGDYNHWGLLAYFILVWTNDTGAYLAGISMGRHKLAKRISPKKTWEGSIGGFIMTMLAALLMWHLQITSFQLQDWLIISSVVVVFGNLGDLAESNLKRALDLKDSGGLLPGHGGLLDRFDAVLFSAPLVLFYLGFLRQFL